MFILLVVVFALFKLEQLLIDIERQAKMIEKHLYKMSKVK